MEPQPLLLGRSSVLTPLLQPTGSCCLPRPRDNLHGGLMAQPMWTMEFKMTPKGNKKERKQQVARIGIWAWERNHRVGSTRPPSCRPRTEYRGAQSIPCTDGCCGSSPSHSLSGIPFPGETSIHPTLDTDRKGRRLTRVCPVNR